MCCMPWATSWGFALLAVSSHACTAWGVHAVVHVGQRNQATAFRNLNTLFLIACRLTLAQNSVRYMVHFIDRVQTCASSRQGGQGQLWVGSAMAGLPYSDAKIGLRCLPGCNECLSAIEVKCVHIIVHHATYRLPLKHQPSLPFPTWG